MSKQVVVISSKNLQALHHLQFVQQTSSPSGQIQEIANVSTFAVSEEGGETGGSGGTATVQRVATAPVSVCYGSGELLNSVVTITSTSASGNVVTAPAHLDSIVGNQGDEGDGEEQSENISAEEYSFQDNDDEVIF